MTKEKENPSPNQIKSFSANWFKWIAGEVIFFYSLLYVAIRIVLIIQGGRFFPNFLIAIPFLALVVLGFIMQRKRTFTWSYAIIGLAISLIVRFFGFAILEFFLT